MPWCGSPKTRCAFLFLVCAFSSVGLTACLQNQVIPRAQLTRQDIQRQDIQDEERFCAAWGDAVGRLHYDEVLAAWKEPSSIINKSDTAFMAVWQWDHSLAITPLAGSGVLPSEGRHITFGERIELTFDRKMKLLQSWEYMQWGARSSKCKP